MLKVKDLCFSYGRRRILSHIDLTLEGGELLAILGTNGAGKSTLLSCLNGFLKPESGEVLIDGRDVCGMRPHEVAKHCALVAQRPESAGLSVYDTVLLGRNPYYRFTPSLRDYKIAESALGRMGLDAFRMRSTDALSGGELQRVSIARALAQQPELLLLDEPTASLDLKYQGEVMRTVREVVEEKNIAAAVVIHDLNSALRWCTKFALLHEGRLTGFGGAEIITPESLRRVYGVEAEISEVHGRKTVIIV